VARLELTDPAWRSFVDRHPAATPFHDPAWAQLVADCYGFRAFAVATRDGSGAIAAGLPVVEVRHLVGRPKWVTLPFTDHCPPLARSVDEERGLTDLLTSERLRAGLGAVEVRGAMAGAAGRAVAVRHVLSLEPGLEAVERGFHPSQVRRNVRRAEREGLTVRTGDRRDLVETFYGLHLLTRHRQGVPIQPKRFFGLIWDRVIEAGRGSVLVVEKDGTPLAAAVFLQANGTVVYKFGASDEQAWSLRPNHLLFQQAIRTACETKARCFDFGRTDLDNEGLRAFKRSWGAVEEPLVYSGLGVEPSAAAGSSGRAARLLGAVLRRTPPFVGRATGALLYRFVA
jgi:CelD/BcsL family acetyltransferase involved in cellulose biosynthesis